MTSLKKLFLLDPEIIFLNHGSFGACPIPVFETYQAWQREMEHQPVAFLGREAISLLANARSKLAEFLGATPNEIVYFSNPTTAINMVARNLNLGPGDEILTSNHEYGAMDRTWNFTCRRTGASYIHHPIALPVSSQAEFVEDFWASVKERTRVIFLSHITSPTALIFPIEEICQRARQAGILTIIDGAHAPGQITLNLRELGADIYTGACHKWLMAPKGAAFLYARREVQGWLEPLVVSWGYESEIPGESQFIDYHEWQGTRDLSAFLSVPAAIEFQSQHAWENVRQHCQNLARQTLQRINALTGLAPICADDGGWYRQMVTVRLPENADQEALKSRLLEDYHIEVPMIRWNEEKFMRISFQGYNTQEDADALVSALTELL